jgi:hypothetical protein
VGVTFQTESDTRTRTATQLLEFHICSPTVRVPFPHIECVRVWVRPHADLAEFKHLKWDAFEEALLSISPVPLIDIVVENREGADVPENIYKWLLEVVPERTILSKAQSEGKLNVRLTLTDRWREWRYCDYLQLQDVLREPVEYVVDDHSIVLKPPEILDVMLSHNAAEKEQNLRKFLAAKLAMQGGSNPHLG